MPRGGKREGAGRPKEPNKKKRYTIRLRPDQILWLKNRNASKTIGDAIDRLIKEK